MRSEPRAYRLRLKLAILRRRAVRWILLRLFKWLESLTKSQLRLLEIRRKANLLLQSPETMSEEEMSESRRLLLETDIELPMSLSTPEEEMLLVDLQLLSRSLHTDLLRKE